MSDRRSPADAPSPAEVPARDAAVEGARPGTTYRHLRLCSNNGGYEAVPNARLRLDLDGARRRLESTGIAVVDARVMLIAATDPEATISRNGRILFKTRDPRAAEVAFERLRALLDLPGLDSSPR
jgi:hypothetical protein